MERYTEHLEDTLEDYKEVLTKVQSEVTSLTAEVDRLKMLLEVEKLSKTHWYPTYPEPTIYGPSWKWTDRTTDKPDMHWTTTGFMQTEEPSNDKKEEKT